MDKTIYHNAMLPRTHSKSEMLRQMRAYHEKKGVAMDRTKCDAIMGGTVMGGKVIVCSVRCLHCGKVEEYDSLFGKASGWRAGLSS